VEWTYDWGYTKIKDFVTDRKGVSHRERVGTLTWLFGYWSAVAMVVTSIMAWFFPANQVSHPLFWLGFIILATGLLVLSSYDHYRIYRIRKSTFRAHGPEQRCEDVVRLLAGLAEDMFGTKDKGKVDGKTIGEWRGRVNNMTIQLMPNEARRRQIVGAEIVRLREWDASQPTPPVVTDEEA